MENKQISNFPLARLKKLLKARAEYHAKLHNKNPIRFQKEALVYFDSILAESAIAIFDDAVKLTELAGRSTMYVDDLSTVKSLKSGNEA